MGYESGAWRASFGSSKFARIAEPYDASWGSIRYFFVKAYFWSSIEYSNAVVQLIRELNARGVGASQQFSVSAASYRNAKSPPARFYLRFQQYVSYPIQLCWVLLRKRIIRLKNRVMGDAPGVCDDVCIVTTNTFYAPLLATFFHPHVVYLVYDLFPEAMVYSKKWVEGSLKVRVVHWITKRTLSRSKRNIFLGMRLKSHVESVYGPVPNSMVIPVGGDPSLFRKSPKQRVSANGSEGLSDSGLTLLYCGNFGNMHEADTLFRYWKRSADRFRYVFHCFGPKHRELARRLCSMPPDQRDRVTLGCGLSQTEWIRVMEAADVALITMRPGAERVVMPSKTYSAMMAGQALLGIAPTDSDLVDLIQKADCGWWVEPGDVDGLGKVLKAIDSNRDELLKKREHAYRYAHQHLGQDSLVQDWLKVIRPR